jgi:hypothetical protein
MPKLKQTAIQLSVLVGGVLGFALLLDQVINLVDEIAPIAEAESQADLSRDPVEPVAQPATGTAGPEIAAVVALPDTAPQTAPIAEPAPLPAALSTRDPADARALLALSRDSWAMVRPYEGRDYLYFAGALTYRCGLQSVRYGVNGAKADTVFPMEPCHTGTMEPNAMLDMTKFPPYLTLPPGTVRSVSVELTYLDGTTDTVTYDRLQILMP